MAAGHLPCEPPPFVAKHLHSRCISCGDIDGVLRCLPCSHSVGICDKKQCHEGLSKRKVVCILCKETFLIRVEELRYLRTSAIVANQQQQDDEVCSSEHETPQKAIFYCPACPGLLCEACHDSHQRAAYSKIHKVKSLEHHDTEGICKTKSLFCSTHKRNSMFVCSDCEVVICDLCLSDDHLSHRVQLVDKDAEEAIRQSLLQCVSSAESRKQKIIATTDNIEDCLVYWQQESQQCKEDIAELRVDMTQAVDTDCSNLAAKVDKTEHHIRTELEDHKNSLQQQSKQLEVFLAFSEEVLRDGATVDQLFLREPVVNTMSELVSLPVLPASASSGLKRLVLGKRKKGAKNFLARMNRMCFVVDPEASTMEGLPVSDNTVHCRPWSFPLKLTVVSRDSDGEQCTTGGGRVDPFLVPTTCGVPVQGEVEDRGDGTYQVIFRHAPSQECRLSVTMNGRHVRGSLLSVSVHTEVKVQIASGYEVRALSWTRQNILVATSRNPCCLRCFSKTGRELSSIYPHCQDNYLDGVVGLSNGNTAVSLHASQMVAVYQPNGIVDRIISPADLNGPNGLAVNSKDELFVVEYRNHQVSVFSPTSGDRMYSFGSKGSEPGQFNYPEQICIDQDNLVYVSDGRNDRVQVFHQDGRFIHQFGQNVLISPTGLGLTKDGHLVVASQDANKLSIFTLTGECVHEVQDIGVKLPYGVAVDDKGFIYVAGTRFRHGVIVKI